MITGERHEANDEDAIYYYLNVELILDVWTNNDQRGIVDKFSKGLNEIPIGCMHTNPLFDIHKYDTNLTDGSFERDTLNLISVSIFEQLDSKYKE